MNKNIDIILNISILVSCIVLYINIPKIIRIILEEKEDKERKIEK